MHEELRVDPVTALDLAYVHVGRESKRWIVRPLGPAERATVNIGRTDGR